MLIGAADPGADGAIAFLRSETLRVFAIIDMPMLRVGKAKKGGKRELSEPMLWNAVNDALGDRRVGHFFLEKVSGGVWRRKGVDGADVAPRMGSVSSFSFGGNYHALRMLAAAMGWPLDTVMPAVWKRALGVPAAKDDARARASQLLPHDATWWTPRRLVVNKAQASGRAEATLICVYGIQRLNRIGQRPSNPADAVTPGTLL